jgi:DNA-binding cell septation regulator SpoVG
MPLQPMSETMIHRTFLLTILFVGLVEPLAAAPTVFWASDPVQPGQTVVVVGEGFGNQPKVSIRSLVLDDVRQPPAKDAPATEGIVTVDVLQPSDQGFKFTIPGTFRPGIYLYQIDTDSGSCHGYLNRPRAWWAQGDLGVAASPGGRIRVFGQNFGRKPLISILLPDWSKRGDLSATGDEYAVSADIPPDLPPGSYRLIVHAAKGCQATWSDSLSIEVAKPIAWPATVFNVRSLGAEGDGVKDDTTAIFTALQKADEAKGGVVYFPRGRYRVSEALSIPRFTVLRGEKREWSCLAWSDLAKPPEALIRGTNSFGIEELTLYAKDHQHVIAGDLGDKPEAGDVFVRRVRVRADVYRGHPSQEEVAKLFGSQMRLSTGGGDTVHLGGKNIEITDSDFYGSGRSLYLKMARGGWVEGNKFYNGRWSWYCLEGCDGLVFANNELTGGDLMSTGGGIANYSTSCSQNIYFAHNRMSLAHGWDREIMTTDAGDGAYFGKIKSVEKTKMTLAEAPEKFGKKSQRDWRGSAVFILAGKGAGQYRRLVDYEGDQIEVDRRWQVTPDQDSLVSITMFHGHYLLVDNDFADCGAMQFYGTSIECIVARNRGTRMAGFRGLGLWYYAFQPSWYCQFLDNEILEGNYYHWNQAGDSVLEISGAKHDPYQGPLNIGAVVRGNQLHGQSCIRVAGTCREVVVEGNRVSHSEQGIFVSRDTERVLVKDNVFDDVAQPVLDEVAEQKAAEAKMARFLGRKEPVAIWDFDGRVGEKFADASGNGFAAAPVEKVAVVDGLRGKAICLDGSSYLQVSEPAIFNAPELTVSLWIKPDQLKGRRGIIAKRFGGTAAPWVISQNDAALGFEAAATDGKWPWNFRTGPLLTEKTWTHLAVVMQRGRVAIFVNGKLVAGKEHDAARAINTEPVIIGRDAWGGDPPNGTTPGLFIGCLDEIRVWTRPLSEAEVQAEYTAAGKREAGTP